MAVGDTIWYQVESCLLIHMALGSMFQKLTQSKGKAAQELEFVISCIQEAEAAGTRAFALAEIDEAKAMFIQLYPP